MDHRSSYFEDLVLFSLQLFDVLHDYTRSICSEKKNRSAIKSNILKKLCNGNVEQLDITGRGSPVILLNHVFWGKIDHRTMNDDE